MNRIGKTSKQKTYELVLEYFFGQLIIRNLNQNDNVPNAGQLAQKLGVNADGIAEVLRIMERNGLLRHNSEGSCDSYVVCCDTEEFIHKAAAIVLAINNLHYSEIITMRSNYEKTALDLAIRAITQEELAHMKRILDGMQATDSVKERAALDVEFHKALMASAHNRMLRFYYEMLSELQSLFIQSFHYEISKDIENSERLKEAHAGIYQALVEKDYIKARKTLEEHFRIVGAYVDIIRQGDVDICVE